LRVNYFGIRHHNDHARSYVPVQHVSSEINIAFMYKNKIEGETEDMVMEATTYYFEKLSVENTERLLQIAKKRAMEKEVKFVVVASTRGDTGVRAAEVFKGTGINVVIVTHQTGHRGPGIQLLTDENKKKLEEMGVRIVTGTDALTGGVGLGLSYRAPPEKPDEATMKNIRTTLSYAQNIPPVESIIASTLRLFCEGLKVTIEIVLMAADADAIPLNQDVIAIAGTSAGANTAILVRPVNTTNFTQMDVHEIIAKPFTRMRG